MYNLLHCVKYIRAHTKMSSPKGKEIVVECMHLQKRLQCYGNNYCKSPLQQEARLTFSPGDSLKLRSSVKLGTLWVYNNHWGLCNLKSSFFSYFSFLQLKKKCIKSERPRTFLL